MVIKSNNATIYGIQEDFERYLWLAYLVIVLISALIGDTIVLIGSTKYNAFKLNKFIIAVIQHMAVCDLILAIDYVIPVIVSLIADRWVFGDYLAYLQEFVGYWAFPVSNVLVCALSVSKLMLVRYPLRTRCWSRERAHVVCGVIWLVCTPLPVGLIICFQDSVIFDYKTYDTELSSVWWYSGLLEGLIHCIPINLIVIISTILTVQYLSRARVVACRSGGSLRWQGILTVLLTGILYCVSYLPFIVYNLMEPFVESSPPERFYIQFRRISDYLTLLNIMSNFYIYSLTVPSFRAFLWLKMSELACKVFCSDRQFSVSARGIEYRGSSTGSKNMMKNSWTDDNGGMQLKRQSREM